MTEHKQTDRKQGRKHSCARGGNLYASNACAFDYKTEDQQTNCV